MHQQPTVQADIDIHRQIDILDHGYIRYVEHWGSDARIIESARMSTNKGFQGWGTEAIPGDEKLLKFLYSHKHMTPFEMCGLTIEVQAPIFVFREWHRHRTQSYNEMSGRYTQMPNLHYVPSVERIKSACKASANKQEAGSGQEISDENCQELQACIAKIQQQSYDQYEWMLRLGLSKELARLNTPVSRYSRMRAQANLRNWLAFLTLRMDKSAQYEIRQYANAVGSLIEQVFPRTWQLFVDGIAS